MTTVAQPLSEVAPSHDMAFATVCGLFSAVLYTIANSFLRAVTDSDPIWVSTVKAVPTVVLVGPWLVLRYTQRQRIWPRGSIFVTLVLGALVGQLGGNVLFQYSLGVVGIAMGVSLTLGAIIVAGAILGRLFLNEVVTLRMAAALLLLIAAFVLLARGAPQAYDSVAGLGIGGIRPWSSVALGVGAALSAGSAYAVLGVVIRYGLSGRVTMTTTMFTVGLVGVISLGIASITRMGASGIAATSQYDLGMMLLAGICNTLAFLALTKALQLTTLVFVNALNATQATMAAVAGVLVFGEPLSPELVWGVGLTIAGLMLMQSGRRR